MLRNYPYKGGVSAHCPPIFEKPHREDAVTLRHRTATVSRYRWKPARLDHEQCYSLSPNHGIPIAYYIQWNLLSSPLELFAKRLPIHPNALFLSYIHIIFPKMALKVSRDLPIARRLTKYMYISENIST